MTVLRLTLKKRWFDMILSGEKKEEYRKIKPHFVCRLTNMRRVHPSAKYEIAGFIWSVFNGDSITPEQLKQNGLKMRQYDFVEFRNGY